MEVVAESLLDVRLDVVFRRASPVQIDGGSYGLFALYAAGSVALGIAATALGFWLAK
jgi:hypothetical protein